jgi:TalC/MipB family fructose-6-phosphate aldolase
MDKMIYVDTANLKDIEESKYYPFVTGITTNPKLIAKEMGVRRVSEEEFLEYVKKLSAAVMGDLFVQTNHGTKDEIISEAEKIIGITGEKGVIKIPVTLPGLQAMDHLTRKGARCAATAVYTGVQAQLALSCGAEFVIPYYSRLEWSMHDSLQLIQDIVAIIENSIFDAKLLVASVKSPFQVLEIFREGGHGVTIPLELVGELIMNTNTQNAVNEFNNAFEIIKQPT